MSSSKKKRLYKGKSSNSGYRGVYKVGKRFYASIRIDRKQKYLGTHETAKAAALTYDRALASHKRPRSTFNFPDGLPTDDEDYDALMNPKKEKRVQTNNSTGFTGVTKEGTGFKARIRIDHKTIYIGTYDTPKEAALAYDRAVIERKRPSSRLNFPNGLPSDDDDYENMKNPKKKRRLAANNTTGYTGVRKKKSRFQAVIYFNKKKKTLGTFATAKEGALAYDRAVIEHKLPFSKLNFPNDYTASGEDNESNRDEESDVADNERDDKVKQALPPFPPAQSHFQGDPMLDQLVAAVQAQTNNK